MGRDAYRQEVRPLGTGGLHPWDDGLVSRWDRRLNLRRLPVAIYSRQIHFFNLQIERRGLDVSVAVGARCLPCSRSIHVCGRRPLRLNACKPACKPDDQLLNLKASVRPRCTDA